MKEKAIGQYIDRIIGKPICSIGRASNMLWIGMGEIFTTINRKGMEVKKSTYALHVQCQWRIVNNKKKEILLAATDMYSPRKDVEFQEDFDWDIQGNNLFDEKSQEWLKGAMPIIINEYEINQWGDLVLFFSNHDKLQTFSLTSNDSECWRLFKPNSEEPHLVVYGSTIEFE